MAEDPLSTRFEGLLKRYKEKLELLDLDLPVPGEAPGQAPAPPKAPEEPAPPAQPEPEPEPILPVKEPEPVLPDWDAPSMQESAPPPKPEPELPAWEPPAMRESDPPPRPAAAKRPPAKGQVLPRRKLWPAALALAALAAALAWGYLRFAQEPGYRTFSLSQASASGLSWREGKIVAADAEERRLLVFAKDGRRLESQEGISADGLGDLSWADNAFWSTSAGRSAIFQHADPPDHPVRRIYATPNRKPSALAGDNENLWASDAQAAVVYRYLIGHSLNGVSLTPLNQYNLPGAPAASLHASDGLLWVLDGTRRLTRYSYDAGTLSARDSVELGARLPAGAEVRGMTRGEDQLWILTARPTVLHRFALKSLPWQPARP